jgi:hypothetical protein
MPYTYPYNPNPQGSAITVDTVNPSIVTGRYGLRENYYWGRYSVAGYPINFNKDVVASDWFLYFKAFDGSFPLGACRVWVYEADQDGLPRTLAWDAGFLYNIGNSGPGTYGITTDPVTLQANKTYWVISQLVLQDGMGEVAINDEDTSGLNTYWSMDGSGFDPVHSMGWPSTGDLNFNAGYNPVGLYIDELQSPGWSPETSAPATLTGAYNDGFYPTAYVATVWLGVEAA